jgi:hypothetical protein
MYSMVGCPHQVIHDVFSGFEMGIVWRVLVHQISPKTIVNKLKRKKRVHLLTLWEPARDITITSMNAMFIQEQDSKPWECSR